MRGRITVAGIRFHAFHGLTKLERQVGVRYKIDVQLETDIAKAARSDRVKDTIDYRDIHDMVLQLGRQNSFHLIETLAAKIAEEALSRYPQCSSVTISARKETPVVDGIVDSVGVDVHVEREG